ncbi:MAG: UDP-N-acetylmuramate dehydrogenase [Lachnospiraceae bacterium]
MLVKELEQKFLQYIKKEDIFLNEQMKKHTTFRVGGPATFFLKIRSKEILKSTLELIRRNNIPYFVIGNGSNLLISDRGFDGVILSFDPEEEITIDDDKMYVSSNCMLSKVAKKALQNELMGLEFAAGIPGTIGGGVIMNAGAYGGELEQVVEHVIAINERGEERKFTHEELKFGYRTSTLKNERYIVTSILLNLKKGNYNEIKGKMDEYNFQRKEKQPLEFPSAGSTFKRPVNHFAGKLIMDAGLAGYRIGGATVSEKHCGFIVNDKDATGNDIYQLITSVKNIVYEKFQVQLEPEIIFLGEFE